MPLASDAKTSGPPASKSGAAKGSPADVPPQPSAALVDAVSKQVADRLGDLLDSKLTAALSGAPGVPPPGTRAAPRSLAPGGQRTPQAGSGQAAAALRHRPPPLPSGSPRLSGPALRLLKDRFGAEWVTLRCSLEPP